MTPEQKSILFPLAISMLHIPYVYGGANPTNGLDCSGLVIELLKSADVLPRNFDTTAAGLWNKFSLEVHVDDVEFGDLVFFGISAAKITHVGFCISNSLMLEAGSGTSLTDNRAKAIAQNARVRIRPIDSRIDMFGFKRPEYIF
jgi:cell wall-associated NlpC family hydrolase